ncbi:helix-turn-helix transcriptional regulator [Escherichia coli]|uniref:helix-turn-helix domain-containing protein n=1 Tax=Escherichia coli TaxID=562 RepID=UPI00202621AE|nr:helix-turn-helix transcriptional regulator [Escherichia coli]
MNLRDYLKEKHITQLQFGKLTGLSQVHVSRVLGGYERFSPEKALRVAEVTNFEVNRRAASKI